jgi:SAM-dependent methyltransferase
MNNYDFCAEWALRRGGSVLDFGCGAGQTVGKLRAKGAEAYGCDTFFEGGDFSSKIPTDLASAIKRMDGTVIPFPDASFDLVINNMVMEHVPDIEVALAEIDRVLKPGGVVLSLFPHQGIWFEGHSMVPFLHRFAKGTSARVYFMYALSFMGFGVRKGRARLAWCRWTCEYLDKWLHYRTLPQLRAAYGTRFGAFAHIEDAWLAARVPRAKAAPAFLRTFIARKFATLAFTCVKGAH